MKRVDEKALAEFYGANGELLGRTLAAEWIPPDKVELAHGKLTIQSQPFYFVDADSPRLSRVPPRLLDRFIALADASEEGCTLTSIWDPVTPSDQKIFNFAARYGGLQIFYELGRETEWPAVEHVEYCEVWRYFARALRALQRIASDLYHGEYGADTDWRVIHEVPGVMRTTARESELDPLHPFPFRDEKNWLALAHFVAKQSQQTRTMFGHLINTLLGLGRVRPWLTWADVERQRIRPKLIYSSRSLLSQLALQLCMRLAKVDAFLVCTHCMRPYSPVKRAPKQGLRHFCPECRELGVPKEYALKDFRARQKRAHSPSRSPSSSK